MVMGEDYVPMVMVLNPGAIYWMDMTFFTLICCKKCIVCLKRLKINKKEAGIGPFFKKRTLIWTFLVFFVRFTF